MGLMRLRAALVGVMSLVLAAMAGRIFDAREPAILLAAAVPAISMLAVLSAPWAVRAGAAVLAVVVSVTLVVVVTGGRLPDDAVDAFTTGLRRLLSTEWPSPDRADLMGAVALVVALATTVAVVLAGGRRWHLVVLVPPILLFVGIVATSAPAGVATWWLVPLAPLGAAVAALRPDRDVGDTSRVGDTVRVLVGDRQLVPLVVVAAGLAAAVSVPLALDDRADPREDTAASASEPLVDPVEAVVALRAIDPPATLYEVSAHGDVASMPMRWRTAALDAYDGQRWTPDAVLAPIGRRLGPDQPDQIDVSVDVRTADARAIPLPGPPVLVDADVETDAARTIVRLLDRPADGTVVDVRAGVQPAGAGAAAGQVVTRPVDEISAAFTNTAESLAGDGTIVERLRAIERTLSEEYELDPSAPGAGVQQALLERFLAETRRGTEEQFVVAFVLLARSLGVEARVATGFVTPPGTPGGDVTLSTGEARIWPEVAFEDLGWVAFDPVPAAETTGEPEEQQPPNQQSPAAAPPPAAQPAEADETPDDEDQSEAADDDGSWPTAAIWAVSVGLALGAVLVPLLIVVGVILGIKHRRRRRRLHVADAAARIRGAWAVATDSLVDAGLSIPPSSTDHEIVLAGATLSGGAQSELERLGAMSSAATYATAVPSPTVADDAVAALEQVETSMSAVRTRWQRLRWRLSLRSLRRATRSPVIGEPAGAERVTRHRAG
jgi:transglutaminase-like putative cysteine protease